MQPWTLGSVIPGGPSFRSCAPTAWSLNARFERPSNWPISQNRQSRWRFDLTYPESLTLSFTLGFLDDSPSSTTTQGGGRAVTVSLELPQGTAIESCRVGGGAP